MPRGTSGLRVGDAQAAVVNIERRSEREFHDGAVVVSARIKESQLRASSAVKKTYLVGLSAIQSLVSQSELVNGHPVEASSGGIESSLTQQHKR